MARRRRPVVELSIESGREPRPDDRREIRVAGLSLGGGWLADYTIREQGGQPVVADLHVYYEGRELPPGGLPTTLLRSLKREALVSEARSLYRRELHDDEWRDAIRYWWRYVERKPLQYRPGRKGHSDEELLSVVLEWLELKATTRGYTKTLADRHSGWDEAYARRLLRNARSRDLLTDDDQLGPRAHQLLARRRRK